jgi:hypothetical protein
MATPTAINHPFGLVVGGVWFGGMNLLDPLGAEYAASASTVETGYGNRPLVDTNSLRLSFTSDGSGGSANFSIRQIATPTASDVSASEAPFSDLPWYMASGSYVGIEDAGIVIFGEINRSFAPVLVSGAYKDSLNNITQVTTAQRSVIRYYISGAASFTTNDWVMVRLTEYTTLGSVYRPALAARCSVIGKVSTVYDSEGAGGSYIEVTVPGYNPGATGAARVAVGYIYKFTPQFRGFVAGLSVESLDNGLGTSVSFNVASAVKALDNIVFFKGKSGTNTKQATGPYFYGRKKTATVTNGTWASSLITYTTSAAHQFTVGDAVTVTGLLPSGYNVAQQLITAVTSRTFKVAASNPGAITDASGTATSGTRFSNHLSNIRQKALAKNPDPYLNEIVDLNKAFINNTGQDPYLDKTEYKPNALKQALTDALDAFSGDLSIVAYFDVDPATGTVVVRSPDYFPTVSTPFNISTIPGDLNINPVTSASTNVNASVIIPRNFEYEFDHANIVKKIRVITAEDVANMDTNTTEPFVRTYNLSGTEGPGLTTRYGPLFSQVVQASTLRAKTAASTGAKIDAVELRYFGNADATARRAPLPRVQFTIRGGSGNDADYNCWGYCFGHNGASSPYAFQQGWNPGETVNVRAPHLGIATTSTYQTFQIVAVSWSFERNSYIRKFDIECQRRRPNSLGRQLKVEGSY